MFDDDSMFFAFGGTDGGHSQSQSTNLNESNKSRYGEGEEDAVMVQGTMAFFIYFFFIFSFHLDYLFSSSVYGCIPYFLILSSLIESYPEQYLNLITTTTNSM